jgi:hypothetical protein
MGETINPAQGGYSVDHDCTQHSRLDRLERDVEKHSADISELKEGQAESRVFQKLIMEQLAEIKLILNTYQKPPDSPGVVKANDAATAQWIGLFKWVLGGTILAIVAWMIRSGL